MISVRDFGAVGDGSGADDAPALQRALDAAAGGAREVVVPAGSYTIKRTLLVGSGTILRLAADALIRLADEAGPRGGAGCFLLTNRDHGSGNQDITVEGGIWDGNNPGNPRGPDGPRDSYTGVAINFVHVHGLRLRGLTVRDPESFFIRVGEARDFVIEDITLEAPHLRPNQDGIHVGGFSEDGLIRRIVGVGPGCPNDDMVALNANDDVTRAVNLGMKEGPIRRMQVEEIAAEDAYTFVRLLSQDAPIEDVRIRGIRGGCRYHALNLNRWRFPPGKGRIARALIEDVEVGRRPSPCRDALIHVTLSVQDLEIRDVRRPQDGLPEIASLDLNNGTAAQALLEGLGAAQRQALEGASTAALAWTAGSSPDDQSVRASVAPGVRLRLPSGGFGRLRIRSGAEAPLW